MSDDETEALETAEPDPSSTPSPASEIQASASLPPPVVDTRSLHPRRLLSTSLDGDGNRTRGSRRSHRSRRSSSRSRSRHRHSSSRHHSRQSRCRTLFKHKERNFAAASCSMIAIVLLCTSLIPDWISLKGGDCRLLHKARGSLHTLTTTLFFYNGNFIKHYPLTSEGDSIYQYGPSSYDIMVNCVNYRVVLLFKAVIAFTLIATLCSFFAFILDLIGPKYHLLRVIRRNSIFNILTVILCVTVNLFAYWITADVLELQVKSRLHAGSKVMVTFQAGFYLVTAAGALSVISTACNCLRRHDESNERPRYLEEQLRSRDQYYDDMEALLGSPLTYEEMAPPAPPPAAAPPSLPPPPAYTP